MKNAQPKPEPVPVNVVCSLCGEPWHDHAKNADGDVTTLECIRLLKGKVARQPVVVPYPYPVYPRPWYVEPYTPVRWTDNTRVSHGTQDVRPLVLNCSSTENAG